MISNIIQNSSISQDLKLIARKVNNNERICEEDGILLYEQGELGFLGVLANHVRESKHSNNTYFIRNLHIEPSNICVYNCRFCSYSDKNSDICWDYSIEEIIENLKTRIALNSEPGTQNSELRTPKEIHITGSANPLRNFSYYTDLLKAVKNILPQVHIKAYSAVELYYIAKKSKLSYKEALLQLKEAGLEAVPGGGAEIFDEELRSKICPEKVSSVEWLKIHETAHECGLPTNATMLYGHIENYKHRIDHMNRLRNLQDETNGFGAFIPLKFKNKNNEMSSIKECSVVEDLKNYAVSRIFLDNFPHIKAYWPAIGKNLTQVALSFGVDDIDGTIEDTTKIYSLAGAEEQKPDMSADEMKELIEGAGRIPVER
jgi:aminodeoxyfutalosine synthase